MPGTPAALSAYSNRYCPGAIVVPAAKTNLRGLAGLSLMLQPDRSAVALPLLNNSTTSGCVLPFASTVWLSASTSLIRTCAPIAVFTVHVFETVGADCDCQTPASFCV